MTTSDVPAEPIPTLTADVPCRKCSYNLRGLSLDGRCPECGSAVGLSVTGDLLRFADPQWVLKLRRGTQLIIAGIGVIVATIVAALAVAFLEDPTAVGAAAPLSEWITTGGTLLGYVVILVGSWLLTEPDPSGLGERDYGAARKLIRVSLAVGAVGTVIEFAREIAPATAPSATILLDVLEFLFGIVGVVGLVAQMIYLKRLALRIPQPELAARAHFLMYAIGISYSLVLVLALIAAIIIRTMAGPGTGGSGPGLLIGIGCFALILGVALLVFGVMYLFLLRGLGKRFGDEARAAQQSWAGLNAVADVAR